METTEWAHLASLVATWLMFWTATSITAGAFARGRWIHDSILRRPEGARLVWTETGKALLATRPGYENDEATPFELYLFLRLRSPWGRVTTWRALVPTGTQTLIARGFVAVEVDVLPAHTRLQFVETDLDEPPTRPKPPRGGGLRIPAFPHLTGSVRPIF